MSPPEAADKVVILDRDGTIVVDKQYLSNPADLQLLPGAAEGLRWWSEHGYRLVVITNQSGVGRGMFSLERLNEVHGRFREIIGEVGARIDQIYYCPHTPEADCACRKPRVQLLVRAASELGFDASRAIVVGDKSSDVEFGRRVGATTVLIASKVPVTDGQSAPDHVAVDLAEAARMTTGH
jgi:D-glycero-D-manno-heptose 1,7-bisphosphate phosphatase